MRLSQHCFGRTSSRVNRRRKRNEGGNNNARSSCGCHSTASDERRRARIDAERETRVVTTMRAATTATLGLCPSSRRGRNSPLEPRDRRADRADSERAAHARAPSVRRVDRLMRKRHPRPSARKKRRDTRRTRREAATRAGMCEEGVRSPIRRSRVPPKSLRSHERWKALSCVTDVSPSVPCLLCLPPVTESS